jgi:hypothetical protein
MSVQGIEERFRRGDSAVEVVELDQKNKVRRIILNRAASLARGLLSALRRLLLPEQVVIILDKI